MALCVCVKCVHACVRTCVCSCVRAFCWVCLLHWLTLCISVAVSVMSDLCTLIVILLISHSCFLKLCPRRWCVCVCVRATFLVCGD